MIHLSMDRTIPAVLESTADSWGPRPAMVVRRGGEWQTITWEEYIRRVRLAARGMISLGLEPGRGVIIIGYNRPEWFIANLAAICAGGIPAGIYTTSTPHQCAYIATHADAMIAVVENDEQLAKLREEPESFPSFNAIVLMDGTSDEEDVITFEELIARSASVPPEELDRRIAEQDPDDLATLIYTSGTTGPPKAVMLSHNNVVWTAALAAEVLALGPDDRFLSYLPLSHIAEQIVSHHIPLACGATTWFAEGLEKLGDNLRDAQPTVFLGVPRVWEKIQAKMQEAGRAASAVKRAIATWAKRIGLEGGYAEQQGRAKPVFWGLANKLVFRKVRERLGLDQARYCLTSAAPISLDTLEYFLSLGIPILEIYGMSECCGPATVSLPDNYATGAAGVAAPGTEIAIAEDGEVLMRGPHVFLGYYKDEKATKETLDDEGWLHSGDIGTLDEHGFLRITDRKKDILITAGGKNIAPQNIEGRLKSIPVVSQAVVIGDRRPYLSALIALDPALLPRIAESIGSPARTAGEAAECEIFLKYLRAQIDEVDRKLARSETIKRFAIIPEEFSVDGGELTPTMKVKRRVVHEKYAEQIARMYS